jgi:hypothetical protein
MILLSKFALNPLQLVHLHLAFLSPPPSMNLSWLCHQCSHSNDSSKNKKRCSLCQAWRDGLAPLSAKGGTSTLRAAASNAGLVDAASDVRLVNNDVSCHDENGLPNNASPCRGGV